MSSSKCPLTVHDASGQIERAPVDDKVTYKDNIKANPLLKLITNHSGRHDEIFFHTYHQITELWFRQIITELDSIQVIFMEHKVHQNIMLIIERLDRIIKMFEVLCDQMKVMETLNPLEFVNFRSHLGQSSGFESFQFRMIENKIGIKKESRILHNQKHYSEVFKKDPETLEKIEDTETKESLFDRVNEWLKELYESSNEIVQDFLNNFSKAFISQPTSKENSQEFQDTLKEITDTRIYDQLLAKGERRLSWESFVTALTIQYQGKFGSFKNEWQLLNLLMDLDQIFMKWRFVHLSLVYRQIGVKRGTVGSSGYYYLQS
uniref:Tryptophan 2,3-dioxygenase n=2 Tax=Clytia hemisphaerica TaxID=252671 RepID=A0A7M5VG24_9CNID